MPKHKLPKNVYLENNRLLVQEFMISKTKLNALMYTIQILIFMVPCIKT